MFGIGKKQLISVTFSIGFIIILLYGSFHWRSKHANDFYQFWVSGQAVQQMEINNLYHPRERAAIRIFFFNKAAHESSSRHERKCIKKRKSLRLAGTPLLYAFFSLISTSHYDWDYEIYRLLSLISFIGGLCLIGRALFYPWPLTLGLTVLLTFFSIPFHRDVLAGNVNQLQVGALGVTAWILSRHKFKWAPTIAGFHIGLIVFFKPNLFLIPIYLFVFHLLLGYHNHLLKGFLGFLVSIPVAIGLPWLLFGTSISWRNWWASFGNIVLENQYLKTSFLGIFFDFRHPYAFALTAATLMALFIAALWLRRRHLQKNLEPLQKREEHPPYMKSELLLMGLAIGMMILTSPLAHRNYFVLLAFPSFVLSECYSKNISSVFKNWLWIRWLATGVAILLIINFDPSGTKLLYQKAYGFLGCLTLTLIGFYDLLLPA